MLPFHNSKQLKKIVLASYLWEFMGDQLGSHNKIPEVDVEINRPVFQ